MREVIEESMYEPGGRVGRRGSQGQTDVEWRRRRWAKASEARWDEGKHTVMVLLRRAAGEYKGPGRETKLAFKVESYKSTRKQTSGT